VGDSSRTHLRCAFSRINVPVFKDKTVGNDADDEIDTEGDEAVCHTKVIRQIDVLGELYLVLFASHRVGKLVPNVEALVQDVIAKYAPEFLSRTAGLLGLCLGSAPILVSVVKIEAHAVRRNLLGGLLF